MCWSPNADIGDGKLEVLLLKPRGMISSMLSSPRMKSGKWDDLEGATVACGGEVEISMRDIGQKSHPVFDVDGDQPEHSATGVARARVLPGALKVYRL
jgi:diacylglycerol kinase family enzyme